MHSDSPLFWVLGGATFGMLAGDYDWARGIGRDVYGSRAVAMGANAALGVSLGLIYFGVRRRRYEQPPTVGP